MRKKRILAAAAAVLTVLLWVLWGSSPREEMVRATVRTSGREFEILQGGAWEPFEVRGVNMGSACPGAFPNEGAISRETYARWFGLIGEMHANTVRVYNLQTPEFYSALAQYNAAHEEKIFLIQTVDFPENLMASEKNILDPQTHRDLFRQTRDLVDALHGNLIRLDDGGSRLMLYNADVSPYVLGYLLGIEWDEIFVDFVDRINYDVPPYRGVYLSCTEDATPFESFLALWGDTLLSHEADRYQEQKMISFCNWPDTDPFVNELQPYPNAQDKVEPQLEVQVDVEHILETYRMLTGIFASYNVYPYYPLFLQYGGYTLYEDSTGAGNPYQGYLRQLVDHHTCPVVISEYGIPSSRSPAHAEVWRGYTHGGLNEAEQAQALRGLYRDITASGCAGSLVFNWQDEWYKRTWNEELISDPNGRAFWSNPQSAEQCFGLLTFEPGDGTTAVYPDGSPEEWLPEHVVQEQDGMTLSTRHDEKYLYFMVKGFDPGRKIQIAIDTLPDAGVREHPERSFSRGVDFILQMDPKAGGDLLVHSDYSMLAFSMSDKIHSGISNETILNLSKQYPAQWLGAVPGNDFDVVRRVSGSAYSYLRHMLDVNEVGHLTRGDANPAHPGYDSNADYCIAGDMLEIRIPWQLLNFRDPSLPAIVDRITPEHRTADNLSIDGFHVSLYGDDRKNVEEFAFCSLPGWKKPRFHERLKPSYYILQEEFKGAN